MAPFTLLHAGSTASAAGQFGELFAHNQGNRPPDGVFADHRASENNRRARYYTLTAVGRKRLVVERQEFDQIVLAIQKVLNAT